MSCQAERIGALADHYRRPMPRVSFAGVVRELAVAAVDVSDGLIADLGHIAQASGVGIEIDLELTPLSAAGQAWFDGRVDPQAALESLTTGGDDYEIALTCHPSNEAALRREADRQRLRLTRIGQVTAGQGISARYLGQSVDFENPGWTHR